MKVAQWKLDMPGSVTIHREHIRRGVKPREDDEQKILFGSEDRPGILSLLQPKYPEVEWIYHVPNQGTGSRQRGAKLKDMGVKSGVWDIGYDSPSAVLIYNQTCSCRRANPQYSRLRIEMKVGTGGLSPAQVHWAWYYSGLPGGSRLAVCYSALDAWDVIREYMKLPKEEGMYEAFRLLP